MSDAAANICKSNGNLATYQNELNGCRTTTDTANINSLVNSLTTINDFFTNQFAQTTDLLMTGDRFYGTAAPSTIISEVSQRNKDLQTQLSSLQKGIGTMKATTERHERDFLDVKASLPDAPPTQNLNVLDDYTMLFLTLSYLVFALTIIFYYTQVNDYSLNSIILSTVGMAVLTCILFVVALLIL